MADSTHNAIVEQIFQFSEFFEEHEELGHILSKDSLASQKCRFAGNKLYVKKNHNEDDHKQILLLYTRSISFAPNNSEDLAKGYSNRSALLMHLHYYEECLVDIDRALQISKCEILTAKLQSRKLDCLKFCGNKSEIFPEKLPDIQPSTKILSASEAVDIEYNDTFGRHLVATRDIKPGEILIVEKGYACFPSRYKIHIICSHCMSFAWNGIPCESCVFNIYCSEKCKQEAWQEYHDVECSMISYMFFDKEAHITNMIVAIRIFIKAVKSEGFDNVINEAKVTNENKTENVDRLLWNGMFISNMFRSCYNLITHTEDNIRSGLDDNFYETMMVYLLLKYTSIIPIDIMNSNEKSKNNNELLILLVNIFTELRNLLDVNSFAFQGNFCSCPNTYKCKDLCDSNRGSIIVPTCSLVNHSCCPNISRMFIPERKVVMYTIAPVKKGQQLCDSYGPSFTMAKKERQAYFNKNFYFTCKCIACEENWPSQMDIELFRNPAEDTAIMMKVMQELQEYFPDKKKFTIKTVGQCIDDCKFDKSTLNVVLKFSELVYKYFDYRQAFYRSLAFSLYIDRSFSKFYGEKYKIPKDCFF